MHSLLHTSNFHMSFWLSEASLVIGAKDEMLIWYETKVRAVTPAAQPCRRLWLVKSVGAQGCLQRRVGVKHDLVGTRSVPLCVFLFVQRQYCSRICQKLCSYWRTTSCLSMSHKEKHAKTKTYQIYSCTLHCTVDVLCFPSCDHSLFCNYFLVVTCKHIPD